MRESKILFIFLLFLSLSSCDYKNKTKEIREMHAWHFKFSKLNKDSKLTRNMYNSIRRILIKDYGIEKAKKGSITAGTLDIQVIYNPITRAYHRVEVDFLNRKMKSLGKVRINNHEKGARKRNFNLFLGLVSESMVGVLKS